MKSLMNQIQKLFSHTHYQKLEEKYLSHLFDSPFKGKSVLDIGCGDGKYLRLLRESCSSLTGVDMNPQQVEDLCRDGYEVFLPDTLPGERKYDILLMSHIIEHMQAEALVNFMDHYLPMLKEDGRLIIITPMPGTRFWYDFTHIRPYTPQSLGMMFGIINAPASLRMSNRLILEDIRFFRDRWCTRTNRHYYPLNGGIRETMILMVNILLAGLFAISGGRLGTLASWLGTYKHRD
ncbi:MAG: class I SAM-dependent methyltransferase [Zoogloeaceae bacterium]|jgi:2-polyprenyl-3-methyl-5-hydroxy-6-metoxy-1,4-benzoquinol methylase|nr:class I SAM-dependent methyltransferase [Zoogloeaceae bacterium]